MVAMTADIDWITAAITKARNRGAAGPDAVWGQIEALLRGRFSERPIPAKELASVAMQLIEAMVPAPPKVEGPQ
jgi:hypothetical protein